MNSWTIPNMHLFTVTLLIVCPLTLPIAMAKVAPGKSNEGHQHNATGAAHGNVTCEPLILPACKTLNLYTSVLFPNALGHSTQHEVSRAFKKFAPMLRTPGCGEWLSALLCLTYAPPCPRKLLRPRPASSSPVTVVTAPACRQLCASAWAGCWSIMEKAGMHWPHALDCETMPIGAEEDGRECVMKKGKVVIHTGIPTEPTPTTKHTPTVPTTVAAVKAKRVTKSSTTKRPTTTKKPPTTTKKLPNLKASKQKKGAATVTKTPPQVKAKAATHAASTQTQAHAHSSNASVAKKTVKCAPKIKPRRYDITDIGDRHLSLGWADVQGQGAANDYCRVIGKGPKKRFLSCALAGSSGQDHTFVSKQGFDVGHNNSWFMRDMDKDGRDDYCRCVGRGLSSKIACMKAGKNGFYGSLMQPGNQYTFYVKARASCYGRSANAALGLAVTG